MSKNDDYKKGYQNGRSGFYRGSGNSDYMRGYCQGKWEYDYWDRTRSYSILRDEPDKPSSGQPYDPLAYKPSTLAAMIGGPISLVVIGWCFVGLILFFFWIGGQSGSWWFPWIWRIAFWGGIGFIAIMSIVGIIWAIAEQKKK